MLVGANVFRMASSCQTLRGSSGAGTFGVKSCNPALDPSDCRQVPNAAHSDLPTTTVHLEPRREYLLSIASPKLVRCSYAGGLISSTMSGSSFACLIQ